MTSEQPGQHATGSSERIYRMLLVAYPRDFRSEYGDDMVQGFRDLMTLSTDGRGVWWRTTRDLISSASKERGSTLIGGGRPPKSVLAVIAFVALAFLFVGAGAGFAFFLIPMAILVALPIFGLTRFRQAWLVRQTTGAAVIKQVLLGIASFIPAAVGLVYLGEDAGYFIFVGVSLALILGSALGIVWAIAMLVQAVRNSAGTRRRWVLPVIILVPSLAVLGFIIGASYNSYRNSLGPPGDHSVQNASADTEALWTAANAGDLQTVTSLTSETCADPWVKFPYGNGRHNAKGQAETRGMDENRLPYHQIAELLGDYMDDWNDRCNSG